MEDYFEGFSEDITRWDMIREITELDLDEKQVDVKSYPSVQLLPRQDVTLYGIVPKMEQRIYSKCKECRLVFNPRDVLLHKSCVSKNSSQSSQSLKKKVKSKKKTHISSVPPPPVFKKPTSPPPSTSTTASSIPSVTSNVKTTVTETKALTVSSTSTVETTTSNSAARIDTPVPSSSIVDSSRITSVSSPLVSTPTSSSSIGSPPSATSSMSSSISTTSVTTSPNSGNSSSSSSRHKKSRKSNKIVKEYDPDVHCGVLEGNKGPCTRSITCSNHRIQLRKLVPGRSKDIHQLIAERKAAKEKDLKHSYMPLTNVDEKEIFCQNTSYVPIVATIVNTIDSAPTTTTFVPIMPKSNNENIPSSTTLSKQTSTSVATTSISKQISAAEPVVINTSKALDTGYIPQSIQNNSQESAIGTVPVVYMPMSPISVVSPVQFVQIGKNMICLESPQSAMSPPLPNQSVFLTIPDQQSNVKMYKSHPKPIAIPTFGTRKVGGAILLSNQRLECQRNDILMAINTRRKTSNSSQSYKAVSLLNNTPHRPNILKVKSLGKVGCKRPNMDKVNSCDAKQIRLAPDVNGFILHADMSESADAPQPNNCIQEKIALLNMK